MQRRHFLSGMLAGVAGLLAPKALLAAWPKKDFSITEFDQAVRQITGGKQIMEKGVSLQAPAIAENGAQVRVEAQSDIGDITAINFLVEKNPVILTARFLIGPHNEPYAAVNLKVRETSKIMALVEAGGKFYSTSREVRVTAGGCG